MGEEMGEIRKAYIIDLESLVDIDRFIWIIDINKPKKPILKITEVEFNLIESGIYKSQDNKVSFNDRDFYLPNYLIDKIKTILKVDKELTLSDLSFSIREFLDQDFIKDINIRKDILQTFKNEMCDIYCICSTILEEKNNKIIKKVDEELEKIGQNIKQFYLINKTFNNSHTDSVTSKKVYVLLSHIFGLNTKNMKFVDEKIEKYDEVKYFTNDLYSLNNIKKDLKLLYDHLYHNSEDIVKEKIDNSNFPIKVYFNLITNNENNLFKKYYMELDKVKNVLLFESFLYRKNFK